MRSHKLQTAIRQAGVSVAGYLNQYGRTSDGKALIALLGMVDKTASFQLQEARRIRSYFERPGHKGLSAAEKADKDSLPKRIAPRFRSLDSQWKRVVGVPVLFGFDFGDGLQRMVFTYIIPWKRTPLTPLRSQSGSLWLLAREGYLHRLRRCEKCKRWLFAVKEPQRCCSAKCRTALHKSSPEYKKKHREHMQTLRQQQKERRLGRATK